MTREHNDSGRLETTRPLEITWARLEITRSLEITRAGLEITRSLEITRASRWLGPLRMTRSAQDDSVRYESSDPTLPATAVKVGNLLAKIATLLFGEVKFV